MWEEVVKRSFGYPLIDLKTTTHDNWRLRTNVLPSEEGFNQAWFQENIPQELLKYLKQQTLSPVPLLPAMQEIRGNMDDVLSRNDFRADEKAKRYFQLQNRYLGFTEKLNTRTRPEEIISGVPAFSTPLNPFNVTPELTEAVISQKPEKESFTPPPLNPAFLSPSPTVETTPQQGPKRKRRRIQFLNYLDDHNAHGKEIRKRSRHKKFRVKSYSYSMGEEDEDQFFIPFKSRCISRVWFYC